VGIMNYGGCVLTSHQRHYEFCVNQYDITLSVNSKIILISPSFSYSFQLSFSSVQNRMPTVEVCLLQFFANTLINCAVSNICQQ
jgi:hypothetical protein